jgi:hypothetical protein
MSNTDMRPEARRSAAPLPMRLLAGAVAGFVAGVVFIALTSWFATTMGNDALDPFRMIATLAQGSDALAEGRASVILGMTIHSVLSVLFGIIFAIMTAPIRSAGVLLAAGLLYGGMIYAVNFQILSRFVDYFSALLDMTNQPFELCVHLVFGSVLAALYAPAAIRGRP